jgi:hypothetical protein
LTNANDGSHVDDIRYYHLKIWNQRRWSPASSVQVFLTRIEEFGPDGLLQTNWAGNVPLRWRDQEFVPLVQSVGAAKDVDFCFVRKHEAKLTLMPLLNPNNLSRERIGPCRFVARIEARSNEVDVEPFNLEVAWDGKWDDGDIEMSKHLAVKEFKRKPEK